MKKKLILTILFLFAFSVYSSDFPIMLNVKSDVKIPSDFRDGVEESITVMGYSLVDEKAQQEALKENAKARKSECYDDECLVDTGKMLAARALISVEVEKKDDNLYKFKGRYIDFETGTTTKSKVMYYESKLDDYKALSKFGKEFSSLLLKDKADIKKVVAQKDNEKNDKVIDNTSNKNDEKAENKNGKSKKDSADSDFKEGDDKKSKKEKKKKNTKQTVSDEGRYSGKFSISVYLGGGSHNFFSEYYIRIENDNFEGFEKNNEGIFKQGIGVGFGIAYDFKSWLSFYFALNSLTSRGDVYGKAMRPVGDNEFEAVELESSPYTITSSYFVLGGKFLFGDTDGDKTVYFIKTGLTMGVDAYTYTGESYPPPAKLGDDLDGTKISTLGFELELGLDLFLAEKHGLEVFVLANYSAHMDGGATEKDYVKNTEVYLDNGNTFNFTLGARYKFYIF